MLKKRFKGCTNTIAGVLYFVHCRRENTGLIESHRVLSEVQTGSQKEIQAVALNKTGTQCIYQCFPPELGGGGRGGGENLRAYSGDYTAKTVTALGNLTDAFGTGAAARKLKKL